jgi:hypothetical protein
MTTAAVPPSSRVPLAVWPVGQPTLEDTKTDRFLSGCSSDRAGITVGLARRIVEEYSSRGDLVVAPGSENQSTLARTAVAGRRAIGIAPDRRSATSLRRTLELTADKATPHWAQVRVGDIRRPARCLAEFMGAVDLICLVPPVHRGPSTTGHRTGTGGSIGAASGVVPQTSDDADRREVYAGSHDALRPGGILVVVTTSSRRGGRLADNAGDSVSHAQAVGFVYLQHVVAIGVPISDGSLVVAPSVAERRFRQSARPGGPAHFGVHHDLTVFAKPTTAEVARVN